MLHYTAGVKVVEKVTVDKVLVSNNRVCGVRTNKGDINCEVFVNCAGQVRYRADRYCYVLILLPNSGQETWERLVK